MLQVPIEIINRFYITVFITEDCYAYSDEKKKFYKSNNLYESIISLHAIRIRAENRY